MIVGSGDYRYRVNADWAKLPDGWSFKEVGGVGVDSHDNVYVFNRGDHPGTVVASTLAGEMADDRRRGLPRQDPCLEREQRVPVHPQRPRGGARGGDVGQRGPPALCAGYLCVCAGWRSAVLARRKGHCRAVSPHAEWATSMRATRVYFSGRSDIGLSRRRTLLSAERKPRSLQPQHSSAVQRPVSGPLRPIQRADAAGRVCPEDDPHDAASEWVGWGRWPWATSANAQSCQSCLLRTKRQIGRPLLTQPASGALGS
jgi:hypothetical protein